MANDDDLAAVYAALADRTSAYVNLTPSATPNTVKQHHLRIRTITDTAKQCVAILKAAVPEANDEEPDEHGPDEQDPEEQHQPSPQTSAALRYQTLVDTVASPDQHPVSPNDLLQLIVSTSPRVSLATAEDAALKRCLLGYQDLDDSWSDLLNPYCERLSWEGLVDECIKTDEVVDSDARLRARESYLSNSSYTERTSQYVDNIIRTIETIKFAQDWDLKASEPGGLKWKAQYLHTQFLKDNPNSAMYFDKVITFGRGQANRNTPYEHKQLKKKYTNRYSRFVTARNSLLILYRTFGCAILLDPFWYIPHDTVPGRSKMFRELLGLIATHMPNRAIANDHQATLKILLTVIDIICGGDKRISNFVTSFVENYPPGFSVE